MTGLKNGLVREYSEMDMGKLVDVLNNKLGDFRKFAAYVMVYFQKTP